MGRLYVTLNCFASPALQILDLAGTFVLAIQPMRAKSEKKKHRVGRGRRGAMRALGAGGQMQARRTLETEPAHDCPPPSPIFAAEYLPKSR